MHETISRLFTESYLEMLSPDYFDYLYYSEKEMDRRCKRYLEVCLGYFLIENEKAIILANRGIE